MVEAAVAIAILGVLATALVSIALSSVRSASDAKLKARATRLVEEAIEVARHTRDLGTTSSVQSLLNIASATEEGYACVDYDQMELTSCSGAEEDIEGIFDRFITIQPEPPGADDQVKVVAVVEWGQARTGQVIEMTTLLSRWNPD
jgi:hypothetical protein